jgi:cell division protein FtsL
MSLHKVGFMIILIVVMTVLLINYIKLQADVTSSSQEIAAMEQQLTQLKAENDAAYNEINDSISLEEVRRRAIQELGMKYADRDQVVIYSGTEKDTVHQVSSLSDK